MNTLYQKIFVGIIALLSIVLLVFSIKNHVTLSIVFNSFVILFSILYIITIIKQSDPYITATPLGIHWPKNLFQQINPLKNLVTYGFLASLFLITLGSLQFDFIHNTPLLKNIIPWLANNNTLLTVFAVILGGATFWISRKDIEKDTEQESVQEELAEQQSTTKFPEKYPRINEIPILRNLVRWMYREGWLYSLGLILVFIIFVGIRLYMFRFSGNYPDEFNHILSGIHLFEHGTFPQLVTYTETWQYIRGAHISFLTGLSMFLFGKTLVVAKLVPITLGAVNFLMLSSISKKIIRNKILILIYLLLFSFLSWSIFNHFYIRGYVFTEFSLILLLFLGFKIIDYFDNKIGLLKAGVVFALMVLITFINFYFSNDTTTYLIPIAFFSQSIFLYYLFVLKKVPRLSIFFNLPGKRMRGFLYAIPVLIIGILAITNMQFLQEKINLLLYGGSNSGVNHIDFNEFFFDINFIFTTLAILSFILLFFIKNKKIKLFFITMLPLLFLHGISSLELQVVRGMMYIFPLFYLSSFIVLDKLPKLNPRLIFSSLTIIIITSFIPIIHTNYDLVFDRGYPSIPFEIGYIEFTKESHFIENLPDNYSIFYVEYNSQRTIFHSSRPNYQLDFNNVLYNVNKNLVHYSHFKDYHGVIRQLYTNTELITDFETFKHLSKNNSCILLRSYSKDHFLGDNAYNYIIDNYKLLNKGVGYTIYCN